MKDRLKQENDNLKKIKHQLKENQEKQKIEKDVRMIKTFVFHNYACFVVLAPAALLHVLLSGILLWSERSEHMQKMVLNFSSVHVF
jgi:hypothetical protein